MLAPKIPTYSEILIKGSIMSTKFKFYPPPPSFPQYRYLLATAQEQAYTDPKRLCDWLVSENNRIFFHEMMWYMCR